MFSQEVTMLFLYLVLLVYCKIWRWHGKVPAIHLVSSPTVAFAQCASNQRYMVLWNLSWRLKFSFRSIIHASIYIAMHIFTREDECKYTSIHIYRWICHTNSPFTVQINLSQLMTICDIAAYVRVCLECTTLASLELDKGYKFAAKLTTFWSVKCVLSRCDIQ